MEELKNILNDIMNVCNMSLSNDEKHELLSKLWTLYYRRSKELGIKLDDAYNLYLISENESFIISQKPVRKEIGEESLKTAMTHLETGLTHEEVETILDFVVEKTRRSFECLGISVEDNSLNGFCELGQALSIMPLENIGLLVTKNRAQDVFFYPFNHCFGTVTFKELRDGEVKDVSYLIDTTYRQFFSTVRCNEGRYYTEEENTNMLTAPDPGYFTDEKFAKELLANGYVELTRENAKKYGESFYKAGLTQDKRNEDKKIDYYQNIFSKTSDYSVKESDLEGFDTTLPNKELKQK